MDTDRAKNWLPFPRGGEGGKVSQATPSSRVSTQDGAEKTLVWRKPEHIRVDDLPPVVVLVQLVCFVVSQVIPGKVVAQHAQL